VTPTSRRAAGCLLLISFLGTGAAAAAHNKEVPEGILAIPQETWHEGRNWIYDPAFEETDTYLEADLDEDPEEEAVIGYIASYKPPREHREGPRMFEIPKKEIPVIEHRVFYRIYDRDAGGHWQCVHTLTGLEQPGKVFAVKLVPGKPKGLLIMSTAGKTYLDIRLYQWREGGYRLLGSTTSSEPYAFTKGNSAVVMYPETESILFWNNTRGKFIKQRVLPVHWKILWQRREVDV